MSRWKEVDKMSLLAAYILPHPPLIIPGVGKGKEKGIQKTIDAYHQIAQEIGKLQPETIIVVSPHSVSYQDYIHISSGKSGVGSFQDFGDAQTQLSVAYDEALIARIEARAIEQGLAAGTLGEKNRSLDHGTLVPLYFIEKYAQKYQVIRISISGLSPIEHYRFGKCLQKAITDLSRRVVLVASGDLSHRLTEDGPYSFAEEGPIFDRKLVQAIEKADFLQFLQFEESFCEAAGECGLRSFIMMAGALDGVSVASELLSYEGPFGVGYAVATFYPKSAAEARNFDQIYEAIQQEAVNEKRRQEDVYVKLARLSLESYILKGEALEKPRELPAELTTQSAGVFVSLKKQGRLRGCIGTIKPAEASIAEEIIRNAIHAGSLDSRFEPVTEDELEQLTYSVDVLGEPESIASIEELDVIRYGAIVSKGRRRGLLLPNLDGVTTPSQQVEIALQKAGIAPEADFQLERFEVVRHT
jgi:AmmeMemoRadiSam system protein A/AmmeMemoRadiSam system protein B